MTDEPEGKKRPANQSKPGGKSKPDDKPQRETNGRFVKGHKIKGGRRKRSTRIPHPEELRDRAFAIAQFEINSKVNGKPVRITLLEANLLTLGFKGAEGDIDAARQFMNQVGKATDHELRFMREEMERLSGAEAPWRAEDDPKKQEVLYEQWMYAINTARGRRESLVPQFPRPRKPKRSSK